MWIGVRSYSIYLWHWPIFQVTRPDLDVPLSGLPLFVLRLALTFGAAELSFRYVETPLRQGALGNWWSGVRRSSPLRRAELRRRGATIGATFAVLVVLVGWGLHAAATNPDREEIELAAAGAGRGGRARSGARRVTRRRPLGAGHDGQHDDGRAGAPVPPPRRPSRSPARPSPSVTR